jgi:hypothetical protein
MQGMTPDELVDYLTKLSTANAQNAKKGTAEENIAESDDGGNGFLDFLDDECKAVVNEAIKQAFDALPGSNFYGDPVQDLLKGAIGLNDDKKDMNEIIDAQHSETMKALEEMYLKMKENDVNANTLTEYGNRFDQFEVEAQERAKAVKAIQDRKDLSDKQKAVQIAAVIGSSLDWSQGKTALFEKMAYAAQTLKGNPKADPKGRNLYQVIYDFNKDYSMFSGEAMDRSEGYIKERINGFVRNCGVAIECLKAHHMVAKLTPEEVAALDPYTRGIYDQIKSDTSSISAKIKSITQIFTGNKDAENASEQTGAFDKVNEYYSQSRTVFINKGKSEVALESKLDAVGADEFEREYWAYGSDSKGFVPGDYLVTDVHSGYRYAETQALTKEQIDAIYKHCVENGWTISEYLCKIGFDLSLIYDVPDCSGAMLITGEQYYDNGWDEHKHGFYGYQIYGNAGKQKCFWKGFTVEGLFSDGGRDLNRKDQWKDGKDMAVLTFRKAGQEYYRDYFNNKYETEKR